MAKKTPGNTVAPLAGARIEITSTRDVYMQEQLVAPLAGARIEMRHGIPVLLHQAPSLPSRERGLKSRAGHDADADIHCRSPRGSED